MIEVAKKAAVEAGNVLLSFFGKNLQVKNKGRVGDFTTEADNASEEIILRILKASFPKHNFRSEEVGIIDNSSDFWWIIDPLDGTISFVSGLPTFGISIGLLKKGVPVLGVINLPKFGFLFWAEKGNGAFLNGKRIYVSRENKLLKSIVGFEWGHIGDRLQELEKLVMPFVDRVRYAPIFGSSVSGLSYTASGVYDAYIHKAYPWDFLAGAVLVSEAGGRLTDFEGKSIDWLKDEISIVASNGVLHNKILSLIGKSYKG